MRKQDLKTGYIVKLREYENDIYVVMLGTPDYGDILVGLNTAKWDRLENYDEDLTNRSHVELDIVGVWNHKHPGVIGNGKFNLTEDFTLLWEDPKTKNSVKIHSTGSVHQYTIYKIEGGIKVVDSYSSYEFEVPLETLNEIYQIAQEKNNE